MATINPFQGLWDFLTIPEAEPTPQWVEEILERKPQTHIRVTLNRPLTWSEMEPLRAGMEFWDDTTEELVGKTPVEFHNSQTFSVYSDAVGSRPLYEAVAEWISEEYVNVYARAVRTFEDIEGVK